MAAFSLLLQSVTLSALLRLRAPSVLREAVIRIGLEAGGLGKTAEQLVKWVYTCEPDSQGFKF